MSSPIHFRLVDRLDAIGRSNWDKLDHGNHPFLSYAFLSNLESSGAQDSGWVSNHLCLYQDDQLIACLPSYIKHHSHGEFVFDWAWADAYQQAGLTYYPKLLSGVPFSPVQGPRLLVSRKLDAAAQRQIRNQLIAEGTRFCEQQGLSSWHCNFVISPDTEALDESSLLPRFDWQFHWQNQDYQSFDDFLAQLKSRKRKKIRHERKQVKNAGVTFRHLDGHELKAQDLEFAWLCYRDTFHKYGNLPNLTLGFFQQLQQDMPDQLLIIIADKDGTSVASAIFFVSDDHLYGRYWGCTEQINGLHFETAYYQGIEVCIQRGLEVFEPGAQGEHKFARGFEPVRTRSYHEITHPGFRKGIQRYLKQEGQWLEDYRAKLMAYNPYKNSTDS